MHTTVPTGQDRPEPHTAARPFGLRFARPPRNPIDLDLDRIEYDEERQISLALDGTEMVPLTDHSLSVTLQTSGSTPREDEIYDKSFR